MQKTAMQELIESLKLKSKGLAIYLNAYKDVIELSLLQERHQIIDAYNDGIENHENASIKKSASEYFKENFGT